MTFVPSHSGEYHVLAVIMLTGMTLRYADTSMSMSDGYYYDGRLSASALSRAFSSFTEPRQRQSTLTITLRDEDLTIRQYLDQYVWGNRQVKIYIGRGRNLADYTLEFDGKIKFPDGISFDRREVQIELRDARNTDWVMLPPNKFWKETYPNLEEAAEGQPIPIAYGDWSDRPVPVRCIDTTTNEFKICDHAIFAIDRVYKNTTPISHTDEDLTLATFRIADYDPTSDVVTVAFQGRMSGAAYPGDVLTDLLAIWENVPHDNIDWTAIAELNVEYHDFQVRRYINEEISSNTLIEELAIECGFDVYIINGQYTARSRRPKIETDYDFDEISIVPDSLKVEADPESLYANRIDCYYKYSPEARDFLSKGREDNKSEQTRLGQIIPRTINFYWLYLTSNVFTVAQHLIMLYSREINVIQVTALGDGILVQLGDRVGITVGHYAGRPLMVREVTKHFSDMSCTLYGYDMIKHVLPGYWTDDTAPNFENATPAEKAVQGFWTDDDGYADPGNEDSIISAWW